MTYTNKERSELMDTIANNQVAADPELAESILRHIVRRVSGRVTMKRRVPGSGTSTSYESLAAGRELAYSQGDITALEEILGAARARDGWDDSDPRYAHLISDVIEDIRTLGGDNGTN